MTSFIHINAGGGGCGEGRQFTPELWAHLTCRLLFWLCHCSLLLSDAALGFLEGLAPGLPLHTSKLLEPPFGCYQELC